LRCISPALLEHAGRVQEAVRGDEVDARRVRPAREQLAQHARRRALAHGDAAREPDQERHLVLLVAEEGAGRAIEPLDRRDVQVEQAGEREVHLLDLAERDALD
jgi:hypothetical protein